MTTRSLQDIKQHGKRLIRQLLGKEPYTKVQIKCPKEYHGQGFGRWCICPATLGPDSIVYSFGIGEDISFDLSIIQKFGLVIHAFDPTPKSLAWVRAQRLPERFKLYEYGLADYNGVAIFSPPSNPHHVSYRITEQDGSSAGEITVPVYTLQTIMHMLHHSSIDLLKIDIEGAEYSAIDQILASGVVVHQILVEVHHRFLPAMQTKTENLIANLNSHNFSIFNISPSGEEYSFINHSQLRNL
jgi:FkbM family methyltransferase